MRSSFWLALVLLFASSLGAVVTDSRVLKPNYIVEYTKTPGEISEISDFFSESMVYGRLRSNSFWYEYDKNNALLQDHFKSGVGGSVTLKTPFYYGLGATAGFYGTLPLGDDNNYDNLPLNYTKTAKDLFRTRSDGTEAPIGVLAVGYVEYKTPTNDLTIGRQIFDNTLFFSNDGKMIPNTFEAALLKNSYFDKTLLQLGYITAQKLRDHMEFHSIIAYERLEENDDASAHKGLSVDNLNSAGKDINPEMLFVAVENKSLANSRLNAEYAAINGYFSTLVCDASYSINIDSWRFVPSVRYLGQFDDGAGAVGGAAISGVLGVDKTPSAAALASYKNANSVDAQLYAAKLNVYHGAMMLNLSATKMADKADIINPWRGFPTSGYGRVMAQTNWYANTSSWAFEGEYDFGKAGLVDGLVFDARYMSINIDDEKSNAKTVLSTDRNAKYFHFIKSFGNGVEARFRFADVDAKDYAGTGVNDSYQEYRFEVNYLF